MKYCHDCDQELPDSEFGRYQRRFRGRGDRCKVCTDDYRRAREQPRASLPTGPLQAPTPTKQVLYRHSISAQGFQRLLHKQGGLCGNPGCGRVLTAALGRPGQGVHVDHDHSCCPGKGSCGQCIRGLLCPGCNAALGMLQDDPERALGLAEYLSRPRPDVSDGGAAAQANRLDRSTRDTPGRVVGINPHG